MSQVGSHAVAVTSPGKSMVAAASKGRGIGRGNFYANVPYNSILHTTPQSLTDGRCPSAVQYTSNSAISDVRHSTEKPGKLSLVKLQANSRLLPHTDCGKKQVCLVQCDQSTDVKLAQRLKKPGKCTKHVLIICNYPIGIYNGQK